MQEVSGARAGGLLDDIPLTFRRTFDLCMMVILYTLSLVARQYLNDRFPNRWIDRGEPITGPARSPDCNSLDYLFIGYLWLVYVTPVSTIDVFRDFINQETN